MSERKVERSTLIDATPEMAFEAVTKASELREWMCDYAQIIFGRGNLTH